MKKLLSAFLLMVMTPNIAAAQEPKTLEQAIQEGAPATYAFDRCAALYYALLQRLEPELDAASSGAIKTYLDTLLTLSTASYMEEKSISADQARQLINQNVTTMAGYYLARIKENEKAGNDPFKDDAMWQSDAQACGKVIDAISNG